jgi:hypothetical protein
MRLGPFGLGRIGAFHAATLAGLPAVEELVLSDPVLALAEQLGARMAGSPEVVLTSGGRRDGHRRPHRLPGRAHRVVRRRGPAHLRPSTPALQTGHIPRVAMQCASVSGLPTADAYRCLLRLLSPLLSAAGLMSGLPISC